MGWTFIKGFARTDVIRKRLEGWEGTQTLAHCVCGDVLWLVRESLQANGTHERWIECDLLEGTGYKAMSECEGPYYYSCPLAYLEMVPTPTSPCAEGWRDKVRAYHASR